MQQLLTERQGALLLLLSFPLFGVIDEDILLKEFKPPDFRWFRFQEGRFQKDRFQIHIRRYFITCLSGSQITRYFVEAQPP